MRNAPNKLQHPDSADDCVIDERVVVFAEPLALDCGVELDPVRVGARLVGPQDAPVVVAIGGISANRRPVSAESELDDGWWQRVLGPAGADLLKTHRVLGFDFLGGNGETTSPTNWGESAETFPAISTRDQARILARLLDELGLDRVEALVSASYGGMVALHFGREFASRVNRIMIIGCAHRPEPMAVARRYVQKQIIALAANPAVGRQAISLARQLAMTTYRSADEFRARFSGPGGQESLQSYLDYQGNKFAQRFEPVSCLRLMDSIDSHAINPAEVESPLTLVGFDSDELCPPALLRELAERAPRVEQLIELQSLYGHDAFLCESRQVGRAVRSFLKGA